LLSAYRFTNSQDLPTSVAKLLPDSSSKLSTSNNTSSTSDSSSESETNRSNKRRKKETHVATAENSDPSWRLPPGKAYRDVFPSEDLRKCPKVVVDGTTTPICNTLHQNGKCSRKFCKFHHGPIIPEATKTEHGAFVKAQHAKSM